MRKGWIVMGLVVGMGGGMGASALAYEMTAVSNGGTISGKALFKGTPPQGDLFKVEKTPEICGEEPRLLVGVDAKDGNLGGVVVVLEGAEKGRPWAAHTWKGDPPGEGEFRVASGNDFSGVEISPKKCNFGPFTGVLVNGKPMNFVNRDPVKHSPHTYELRGRVRKTLHNEDLEGDGKLTLNIELEKSRIFKLECDQHNFMQNFFYAVDNPYYAISTKDGSFTIDQIPPGSYALTAWHPILGRKTQDVTVASDGKVEVQFEFSAE